MTKNEMKALKVLAQVKLSKDDFWEFCKAMDSKFYKESKPYLKDLCTKLQYFHDCPVSEYDVLLLNMPPRAGKSYTLELLEVWSKCKNPKSKSIIVCYNENLSLIFSKSVRNLISTPKLNKYKVIVNDIFPKVHIKRGSSSQKMWSLEESEQINFLATSPGGTVTGMAAGDVGGYILIDDLIKNAYEAFNDRILDEHWDYFTQTLMSRREKGSKMIICFTRWSKKDLIARYEQWAKDHNKTNIMRVIYKMEQDDGSPLDESIMTKEEMEERKELIGKIIWNANYQQSPEDIENNLYTQLRAYVNNEEQLTDTIFTVKPKPNQMGKIFCVCDTADSGEDYTCAIVFTFYQQKCFILDVLYTQQKMEVVEELLAKMLDKWQVQHTVIEANNGGNGFARNVKRILTETYRNHICQVEPFTQTKNKSARIFSNAPDVQRLIYFPIDWFTRYEDGRYIVCENKMAKDYIEHLQNFVSVEDDEHDDAEDATTLVIEFGLSNGYVI